MEDHDDPSRAGVTPRAFAVSLGAIIALALPLAESREDPGAAPAGEKGSAAAADPAPEGATAAGAKVSGPTSKQGTISGRVVSAVTGKPVPKAYAGTGDFGDSGGSNYERHKARGLHAATETDADGRFVLSGLAATGKGKDLEAHALVITHPDFVRADAMVDLPEGEGREVEVRLKPAAKLRVEVPDGGERKLVLLRVEALDGRRFIPPGRDPHLSAFASSAWTERLPPGKGFTFTGLEEGEFAVDAIRLAGGTPFLQPSGTAYVGGAKARARSGETIEVRLATADHGTEIRLGFPEIPPDIAARNPQVAAPFVLISRNPGLLVWADGLARGLEDPRLGRLEKEALLFGALPPGTKSFSIRNLPPGTYAAFTGPVVCLHGRRITLGAGAMVPEELLRWLRAPDAGRVPTHGMDRPLALAAGDYAAEDLCRILSEAAASRPALRASPSIAKEKVTFARPTASIWDAVEKACEQKGWAVDEEPAVLLRTTRGELPDCLWLKPNGKRKGRL